MASVQTCVLPEPALLGKYARAGAYTDCYCTHVLGEVSHAEYVAAFYTTPLFKLERWILAYAVAKPSTDLEAQQLAGGARDAFAAWRVEERTADQLLLCDLTGHTRSWLMSAPAQHAGSAATRLYFGSAVVARAAHGSERARPAFGFRALLGFHRLYSKLLLRAARARLTRRRLTRQ